MSGCRNGCSRRRGSSTTPFGYPEFAAQIADYLKTLGPGYPKNIDQLLARATEFNALRSDGAGPNPNRWTLLKREAASGGLDDYRYTSVRDHALPMVRAVIEGLLTSQKLDALVYPTLPTAPAAASRRRRPAGRHRRNSGEPRQSDRLS